MKYPEWADVWKQKVGLWFSGAGGTGGWALTASGYRVSLGGDGDVLELVVNVHLCIKHHWILHFKRVNFMVRELYINKAGIKKKKPDLPLIFARAQMGTHIPYA